ncbi:MAG: amidophosphoribosyltransferase [Omnitrophica WOR_2 bacterium GWF2_38_59]|nr:MAG: amidophosphoribosyltransferase [Omnitrophica WOR_2 bacterium GWA2_37_7]OGX23981.1 MAG: amidophosphoribosyltransferase [Omnitrophica WOR_2 bacterium GWF2_38_59]OGX46893.1 MAG: amidophosphoribosyltransferase [Omnitrophica WOR_2 bacterium RIFOXYA2_FULL_38_17]OGX52599.1 MAG: amidophosphoribosyltransferase [Omnitrophica WOR_2 bacterium RIFOXYA12_FULL_38_10]OGX55511.1 MAG: amidophosphoribosyltransferase [Omnitrophica WOR_2 bacterium RIFOXYC2_FULL_38_12]OGX58512.1 MAG: amidophosphoribosyltran
MSGLFGAVSQKDCVKTLFYGIDYHSHLGTEYGGMVVLGDDFERHIHDISKSQFKSKFYDDYKGLKGNKGIGVISDCDPQPIYLHSKFGPYCIVTTGFIENKKELEEYLFRKGISFSEVSSTGVNMTELIAKLVSLGENIVEGIEKMFEMIEGSCSLLILTKDGIYAARDRLGYTPLVIGKKDDEWVVASESNSFCNFGYKLKKFLMPGEIILINEDGISVKNKGTEDSQICAFLWIYTGFPAAYYEGINVETVRENCGRALAMKDKDIKADVVSGVPDSGTAHAIGYAMESGVPYRRPLIKYTPGYGRSYTPPSQETRDLVATMKLIAIDDIIKGNRLIVCDDSIVRGTQLKNYLVKKLENAGAKEIHVRPACPPLMFPCKFCLSTRSINELAARKAIKAIEGKDIDDVSGYIDANSEKYKKMVDWIEKDLGVTTLRFQDIEDMVKAIGLPREKLCLYCWTGECPSKREKNDTKVKQEPCLTK